METVRETGGGRGSGCVKIGQKSEPLRQPIRLCNCSQRSSGSNSRAGATTRFETSLHYLCCLKTVVWLCVYQCVSVSRRVAKPIDVLRVTSCGQRRRVSLPDATAARCPCKVPARKTAPIYHFPGTGTVNTRRRVHWRRQSLLPASSLFLYTSTTADDKWLPELTSRRV